MPLREDGFLSFSQQIKMTTSDLSFGQINAGTDQRVDPVGISPGQSGERLPRVSGESPVFGWVSLLWRDG